MNDIKIFKMNDCDWWAGRDLESIKPAMAAFYSYTNLEDAEADTSGMRTLAS